MSRILPEGHQPQLDEGLEAVADAQDEAVPVLQQVHDRVADRGGPEKAVMNLPEPSGSSPPEKPPGRKMIWLLRVAWANRAADAATWSGV